MRQPPAKKAAYATVSSIASAKNLNKLLDDQSMWENKR